MCSHVILKSVLTWIDTINCLNLTCWCINLTDMFIILSTFEICLVAISLLLRRHSIFTFHMESPPTPSLLLHFSAHRWRQQQRHTARRRLRTKTLTICSRSSSSATAAWAKPPSCSATLTTPLRRPLSARWALISR